MPCHSTDSGISTLGQIFVSGTMASRPSGISPAMLLRDLPARCRKIFPIFLAGPSSQGGSND